jgi:hypothetical protein
MVYSTEFGIVVHVPMYHQRVVGRLPQGNQPALKRMPLAFRHTSTDVF